MHTYETDWEICAQTQDRLGESILWHPQEKALYWIDYYGPFVHRKKRCDGPVETWKVGPGQLIGSLSFSEEGLLLAMEHGLYFFDPQTGAGRFFSDPKGASPDLVYNDAKVDRSGSYWVGTLAVSEVKANARFYRLASNGSAMLADEGFAICNGPAFSPDNRSLYFSDSLGRRLLCYDLGEDGQLSGRRTFFTFSAEDGLPDGLTVDSAGDVWCAMYGGGKVVRIGASGTLQDAYHLPTPYVTSLCFGGPGLKTLFVTTGWDDPDGERASQRSGGTVFMRHVDVSGVPEPRMSPAEPSISETAAGNRLTQYLPVVR